MFNYTKKDLEKSTLQFVVTIPKDDIQKRYEESFKELAQSVKVEGFRTGKVPLDVARKHIGKEKIYDGLIHHLLPQIYEYILKNEKLQPAMSPKIELKQAKEEKDWIIEITIALRPIVAVPDYKKIAQTIKAGLKKEDIWVPGKSQTKEDEAEKRKKQEKIVNDILGEIIKNSTLEISQLIIDQEVNAKLARLVDDIQKIGMTMDAYLQSKKITSDQIKEQIQQEIIQTYTLEFILAEIADKEKITVEKNEIDTFISSITDVQTREQAEKNRYLYASLMRKQKVIDYLASL
ncbi:hypothetical protein A2956_00430 [Candidatus Roizmanbacteria bacterium RIFCSPLOWO2_01_FULL_37_57]|nr:MAG: hypothetical protein A3E10_05280 [Candidatus Roizmanbacteria bacterium RIFCSPHIGHO2_12_FULL_37_23]OGK44993.1 MAG: hypothetical protein A2956_00430 [Candidatus Roizmanbacteria bacterium RIFCSPLOWO2_01_FULL_37_57]OGK58948.1 MAG: hypothetical protein A3G65_04380 [Candidatus Roizmanbacteria bacterium RIFCSPLOWO2_12_FULL_37_7b]